MTSIIVKSNFVGFHCWLRAPDEVSFLREYHRHIFYVELKIEVKSSDRELEFFTVQNKLKERIDTDYRNQYFHKSCEMIAEELRNNFLGLYPSRNISVLVSEDGENSALCE
jgi:hypothetical protein